MNSGSNAKFLPPILSKLIVSPFPNSPSPSALTTNQDGQFSILTKADINIFTPAYGLQVDLRSIFQSPKANATDSNISSLKGKERATRQTLPIFKTCITLSKNDKTEWSWWSDDERTYTGASGNNDVGWRSLTWSPSGLSSLGGCVLAAISNNNEVILYEPRRDAYRGEWSEVDDLTNHLTRLLLPDHNAPEEENEADTPTQKREITMKVLECQATCLAWSSQVIGGSGDFSLLVVGHRSGHISIWRRWIDGKIELLKRYRINDRAQWIVNLSWSPWTITKSGSKVLAVSHLAVADSRGGIWTTAITQDITSPRTPLGENVEIFGAADEQDGVSAEEPLAIGETDGRAATTFCWVLKDSVVKLVYTKLGTVNFVTFILKKKVNSVESNIELEIRTEGAAKWIGANSMAVCCGIEYLPSLNVIVLALASSSFHTYSLGTTPALVDATEDMPSSSHLTALTRQVFATVTSTAGKTGAPIILPNKSVGAYVYGFSKFSEDGSEMGYVYTRDTPDSLLSAIGIHQLTTFVLSSYLSDMQGEEYLAQLKKILTDPPNSRLYSPQATLQPVLHFLADNIAHMDYINSVLETLALVLDDEIDVDISPVESSTAETAATDFVDELYGNKVLEGLKLRETVARFIVNHHVLSRDQKPAAVLVQNQLCRQVNKYVIARLSRVLGRATPALKGIEMDISGRILIASAALSSGPVIPLRNGTLPSPYELTASFGAPENCPACAGAIPFQNIRSARCENGHEWERCSITLTAMATVKVRTCTGCERKALNTVGAGEEELSSVCTALLKASTCCIYCGGRWMRLR